MEKTTMEPPDYSDWMDATETMATDGPDGNLTHNFWMDLDFNIPVSYTIVIAILMIVVVVGVIGNLMVIIIVFKDSTMRTTPNAMVASLAVADLVVLLMSVPYKIIFRFAKTWPFGTVMCKVVHHLGISCGLVSVYSLVALSADRYHAIVRPISYTGNRSACKLSILVGSLWVICIALGVPPFIWSREQTTLHPDITFCYMAVGDYSLAFTLTSTMLTFVLPLVLISVYYSRLAWRLLQSAWAIPGDANVKRPQLRSRKRLAIVVLAIVVLFAVLWFPHICVRLFMQFHPDVMDLPYMREAKLFSDVIKYLNPCINPYILCFISSTYRKHFRRSFCWLCSRKRRFDRARSLTFSSKGSSTRTKFTEFLPM